MADEASAERESQAEASSPAGYASVIYFHGMGSQRRYEEVSSLIDRIDQYLVRRHRSGASLGILRNIKARVEPLRPGGSSNDIVGHIRTVYSPPLQQPPQQAVQSRAVRFYEVYWAPVMAGTVLTTLPMILIFLILQKPMIKG